MVKNKDRWSALSMSERADLIKLYVSNGITSLDTIKKDYNSFGDGGSTDGDNNNNSTTPTKRKLTLEEFLQAKADSTRVAAHAKSLSRDEGVEIIYPLSESRKEANQQFVDQYYDLNPEFIGPTLPSHLGIKPSYDQAVKELNNNCEYGLNCIGTATDNYPEDSREVSNKAFRENYEEKGFYIVPFEEKLPGDIVQQGGHSVIFDSYKRGPHPTLPQAFGDAYPVYNYSNGGIGTEVYRKQKRYPFTEPVVYRYVGTPTLIQQWTEEYNAQNKKFGGVLNSFGDGGYTENNQPVISEELNPSVVVDYSNLKQEAKDARDWVFDYYASEGYKNRARQAGLKTRNPLKKHLGIFPKKKLRFEEDWSVDSSYNWLYPVIGLQESENPFTSNHTDEIGFTTAHEFAHNNKLFNSPPKSWEKPYRSPYYGYNYKKLPNNYSDALEVTKLTNPHDSEFNESYSDLIGLRYLLNKYGIFDSTDPNAKFDFNLYKTIIKDDRFKNNRFLKLHDVNQVIKAINEVAQNTTNSNRLDYVNIDSIAAFGGKLNRFEIGEPTREMTPLEAAALNKTLNNSQYMLAVGNSPDDPAYLSTDVLEPAVVKSFNSNEDYNRYYGEQFGKQIVDNRDKLANKTGHLIWDVLQFHPWIGTALDAAEVAFSDNKEEVLPSALAFDGKITEMIESLGKSKKVGMGTVFGKLFQFTDLANDVVNLISDFKKPVSEYKKGGELNKN